MSSTGTGPGPTTRPTPVPATPPGPVTGPTGRERAAAALRAEGTPEAEWARWDGWRALADAPRIDGPVVVVAAHPDDEVLGVGGTLARLTAAGAEVHVVTVTDGEASHPGSRRVPPDVLARLRADELGAALDDRGARVLRTNACAVETSGRLTPRAPHGFGAYLSALRTGVPAADAESAEGGPVHPGAGRWAVSDPARRISGRSPGRHDRAPGA
ncbi:PIG-L family deacetylase [Streptomyces sp. NBC_01335]|uniref:PIG-L deacetylase family protein n=1 Tax=Streptomyces sp. NBC_01335 TaxID=2903828 RepID=UPI002E0E67A3|nr:PIG-L family deacetylase [Streptomyces sp. NBC_01335]